MTQECKTEFTQGLPQVDVWLKQNGFGDSDANKVKSKLAEIGLGIDFFMECDKGELSDMCKVFGFGVLKKVKLRKLILESLEGSRLRVPNVIYLGFDEQKQWDKLYKLFNYACQTMEDTQTQIQNLKKSERQCVQEINAKFEELTEIIHSKRQQMMVSLQELSDKKREELNMKYKKMSEFKRICTDSKDKFREMSSNVDIEYEKKKIELKNIFQSCYTQLQSNSEHLRSRNIKQIEVKIDLNPVLESMAGIKVIEAEREQKNENDIFDPFVNWDNAKVLDLTNGTGGETGQTKYVANGVEVEASHAVYNNQHYYYMGYMFNRDTTTSEKQYGVWSSFWLTSTQSGQTLTFTFPTSVQLSHINVYTHTGYDTYRAKYGIDLFYGNQWNALCEIIDTSKDVLGVARKHEVRKVVDKVRFNLDVQQSFVCMKEIDFFVVD